MAKKKIGQDEEAYFNPREGEEGEAGAVDAPVDGRIYGRRNGQWVRLAGVRAYSDMAAMHARTNGSPAAGKGSGAEKRRGSD